MARPLRLEFAGGLYHVTSQGDRREDIFTGGKDRLAWREIVADVCELSTGFVGQRGQARSQDRILWIELLLPSVPSARAASTDALAAMYLKAAHPLLRLIASDPKGSRADLSGRAPPGMATASSRRSANGNPVPN